MRFLIFQENINFVESLNKVRRKVLILKKRIISICEFKYLHAHKPFFDPTPNNPGNLFIANIKLVLIVVWKSTVYDKTFEDFFHVLMQLPFASSRNKQDYYHHEMSIHVTSRVVNFKSYFASRKS